MSCEFALHSPPPSGSGAIAVVQLRGDIAGALDTLGLGSVAVGKVRLCAWAGVDEVVVARISSDSALVFPHAGRAVLDRVVAALRRGGLTESTADDPRVTYPEASSLVEARMLRALAAAESPLAIDLLLAQPRRWEAAEGDVSARLGAVESAVLRRLIDPPLVVALGAPNIGKSSLLNALAGRAVAIVADEPGTTRDHVGVSLDFGGLVIRYIDTPGLDEPGSKGPTVHPDVARAREIALLAAAAADLVLLCADSGSTYRATPAAERPGLRVGTRCDLGLPAQGCEIAVSARTGEGLAELVTAVRERLVPPALMGDHRAWTFW